VHTLRLQRVSPYAEAIAAGAAEINQCPPGGLATIVALGTLLHREARPLNPRTASKVRRCWRRSTRTRASVREMPAPCPVDAIIGARKQMHTVIAELCTGCELCVAPCRWTAS